ncbi:MAG: M56 family metallopeptidase, partial [Gemmataceae bacterium]
MADLETKLLAWLVHGLVAGAVVLLLVRLGLIFTKSPEARFRLCGWGIRGALLAVVLSGLGGWLPVPVNLPIQSWSLEPDPVPVLKPDWNRPLYADASQPALHRIPQELLPQVSSHQTDVPADRENDFFETIPPSSTVEEAPPPAPPVVADRTLSVLRLIWVPLALVALFTIGRVAIGLVGLYRLTARATPTSGTPQTLFELLAYDVRPRPRLRQIDGLASPCCFGLFHPTVLLPKTLAQHGTPEQLRWILAHELDHIRRGDVLMNVALVVARALFFPVPWYWTVQKELRLAQEQLADAAAARLGGRPVDYAAFLVSFTARPDHPRPQQNPFGTLGVRPGRQSELFRRVQMLLNNESTKKPRLSRRWSLVVGGGVLGTAVLLSGLGVQAQSPEKPKPLSEPAPATRVFFAENESPEAALLELMDQPVQVVVNGQVSGGNAEEIAKLKKDLTDAAKKGDVEAVKKLADQLEKAAGAKVITMTGQDAGASLPAVPAVPGTPGIAIGGKGSTATIRTKIVRGDNAEIAGFEKAIAGLKKSAEELKDNPEAKAAIDKTIAEYRKKIEEAKARGEVPQVMVIEGAPAVGKKPIAQVAPLPPLPAIAPIPPGGLNFGLGVNREAITDQLKANLDSTLKSYRAKIEGVKDNAEARKALEKAMESYEAAMKAAIAGMALDTARIWEVPGEGAEGKFFRMIQGGAGGEKMTVRKVGQGRFGITPALIPDVLIEQLD